jgi:hypothetical protein
MRLLNLFFVLICILSLNLGCSDKTDPQTEFSKDSISENSPTKERKEEAESTSQPRRLFESEQINLVLYGATVPEQYDSEIGLLYKIEDVIRNSTVITEEEKKFFTKEAWESPSLQYLIQYSDHWDDTQVFPVDISMYTDMIRGILYIDLLKGQGAEYKPAILWFKAEKIDGMWKYTQFRHLDILKSFGLEGEASLIQRENEIIGIID